MLELVLTQPMLEAPEHQRKNITSAFLKKIQEILLFLQ